MCGIVGAVNWAGDLDAMIASLAHRGPDDAGRWQSEDGKVKLGHTRLSVLDLTAAGKQPMVGAAGQVSLVYNGEIYNYPQLRQTIEVRGGRLQSGCDTEALLALYLRDGISCFEQLVGMFAFGLYDARTESLILGRDRAGKKPLYWSLVGDQFVFASELKAFCALPHFETKIDSHALLDYLQFDFVPTPSSIYEGVHKLLPGHYLILQKGKVTVSPFWQLDSTRRFEGRYEDACVQMDTLVDEAVRCRLSSDVPLGVFLSGGLDSSAVASYAVKHHSGIQTFSIAFEDPSYDESHYAQMVANHLGTNHSVWQVTSADMLNMLQSPLLPIDEPLGDTSVVPTFLLAQHTRQHVTVALGGDGGDELFAGYPTFWADVMAQWGNWVPRFLWRLGIGAMDKLLKPSSTYLSANFKLKQFLQGMAVGRQHRHQRWLGSFSLKDALSLFHSDIQQELRGTQAYAGLAAWQMEVDAWQDNNSLLYEYFRTYLMDSVMVKVDRACMATSLEARSPFLDHRVVEFAFSLPYEWKFRWGKEKRLLKDIMREHLPKAILDRPKKGFGMPISGWLKDDLSDWARAQLEVLDIVGIVPQRALALHDRHLSGQEDLRKPLWNLIALALFIQYVHKN